MKTESRRPTQFHRSIYKTGLLTALLALSACMINACGDPPPPSGPSEIDFGLEVYVYDQNDAPVAKVPVLVDGQVVGYTDKNGTFAARIIEKPNTPIEISAGNLSGYRFTSDQILQDTLTVRQGVDGNFVGIPLTLRTTVHSLKNSYLTWVQLKCDESLQEDACANLPLKLDGKEIARTDQDGKAHFAFEGIIGTKSVVTVDTPVFDKDSEDYVVFDPKQPSFELNLGLDNTVFVIEESFTDLIHHHAQRTAAPVKKATTSRTNKRSTTSRPKATTKSTPKKAPAKKAPAKKAEPKSSVIDLW